MCNKDCEFSYSKNLIDFDKLQKSSVLDIFDEPDSQLPFIDFDGSFTLIICIR